MAEQDVTLNDKQSKTTFQYDQYNNITDQKDYDWGAGTSGGLLRDTQTVYLWASNPAYAQPGVSVLHAPFYQFVCNAGQSASCGQNGNQTSLTVWHYDETGPADAPGIVGHDGAYGTGFNTRGNLTSKSNWIGNTTYLRTAMTYDVAGNVLTTQDPKGNNSTFSCNDDGSNEYAFPTSIKNSLGQVTSAGYDYNVGKPVYAVNLNNGRSTYAYNDPLDRLTQSVDAAGAQTNVAYVSPTEVDIYKDQGSVGDRQLHTASLYDGFGRESEGRTYETNSQYISTTKTYDVLGRVVASTNPSRPGDGLNYSTNYLYDSLGRTSSVQTPDGQVATSVYSGSSTTTTDQAGKARSITTDALGRVTTVREDPAGLNYLTQYSYDPNGNLVQVSQGAQTRTFAYDAVSRLSSASNPESGTTNYLYDNNGNLTRKTDARGKSINYAYDPLNRITGKTYSDGTFPVTYMYDTAPNGVGRLAMANATNSLTGYTGYDALGRVTSSWQASQAQVFYFSYGYNLAGSLTSETYPSGRVVTTQYDGADRPIGVNGRIPAQPTTSNYVSAVNYAPHGGLWAETYGNNVTRSKAYNNRLQPSALWDAKYNNPNSYLFIEQLNWGGAGNNGNLQGATTYEGGPGQPGALSTFTQSYSYDSLNRLTGASDSGGWSRQFAFDQYGNMALTGNSGVPLYGTTPMIQNGVSPFNAANNRLLSATYDQAGNQTVNGSLYLYYDGEAHQVSSYDSITGIITNYYYDDQGRRVINQTINGPTTVYVYDALGQKVADYSTAASSSPCQTCYMTYDHLGSTRVVTDQNGSVMGIHDYLPFGEEIPAGWAGRGSQFGVFDDVAQKFTGKERDWQSGLDYFGARYYGSGLGRFTSPDWSDKPEPVPYADLSNPQSLNLYTYVLNNPLAHPDADGHCCEDAMQFGEELMEAPNPLMKAAGYAVIGAAAAVTVAMNPAMQEAVTNKLDKAATNMAQNPAYPGPYVGPLSPIQASSTKSDDEARKLGPVKAADAPGVTAGGQATNEHGQKLAPSGRPQINNVNKNTREAANNAANKGSGTVDHTNPKRGGPHFHTRQGDGTKKQDGTHYNYPD